MERAIAMKVFMLGVTAVVLLSTSCGGEAALLGGEGPTVTVRSAATLGECTANSQCPSNFCRNGVCCNTSCSDATGKPLQCYACNLPGKIGICSPKSNGAGCDDGNQCTQLDSCQAGVCTGGNPKACPAVDQCRPSTVCSPSTGLCPVATAGTSCSDGNVCNGVETCDGKGVCKAGRPMICVGSAGCLESPGCNATSGCVAGTARSGQTCTATNACSSPSSCTTSVNLPDPTDGMEDYCWRVRDVPLRFIDYRDQASSSVTPSYVSSVVTALSDAFAKACITFHPRQTKWVDDPTFRSDGVDNDASDDLNWSELTETEGWRAAVPQNPGCKTFSSPPSGTQDPGDAARYIFRSCAIPDELIIMSNDRGGGFSDYPTSWAYISPGTLKVHEVGHNFSLPHAGGWPKPTGVDFGTEPQTQADFWDLFFKRGDASNLNLMFKSYDQANTIADGTRYLEDSLSGIHLPGTYVDPVSSNSYVFAYPPKTGPVSCENPPNTGGPCSTRHLPDQYDEFCVNCEFRRMYEAWNGAGSFPPAGMPLGLLYAPGQALRDWRNTGTFSPGFSGFEVQTGDGTSGPVMAGLAPRRTKLQKQRDPAGTITPTIQLMSYETGYMMWHKVGDTYTPYPNERRGPKFDAMSDSQAVLVRNTLKADVLLPIKDPTFDPLNPVNFGHYPARGGWERIGANLVETAPPAIVAAPGGVFIAGLSAGSGRVISRRWSYGDAPWASQSNTPTVINGQAWRPVLPAQPRTVQGAMTAAFRSAAGVFDIAIHQVAGGVDVIQHASTTATQSGMLGWGSITGATRGAPIMVTRVGSEGERLDVFTLEKSANPQNDRVLFNEWRRTGFSWNGWGNFGVLPDVVVDGLDAAVRPITKHVDLVAMTSDGSYHLAILELGLGSWSWGDLGNPLPNVPGGKRPSIADTVVPGSTTDQRIDIVVTDGFGRVWHKMWSDGSGWLPSLSSWSPLGGESFGRAVVTQNVNGDVDVVARDTRNDTVMFKRLRRANNAWSPSASDWFNLGGEGVTDPVAIPRAGKPDVVDVFTVSTDGSLWHRPFVVPPFIEDPARQRHDIDYDAYCGCGFVSASNATSPAKRLGTPDCPCSR